MPWCIESDFNVARCPSERLGKGRHITAMWELSNFSSELDWLDLPLIGVNSPSPVFKSLRLSLG